MEILEVGEVTTLPTRIIQQPTPMRHARSEETLPTGKYKKHASKFKSIVKILCKCHNFKILNRMESTFCIFTM